MLIHTSPSPFSFIFLFVLFFFMAKINRIIRRYEYYKLRVYCYKLLDIVIWHLKKRYGKWKRIYVIKNYRICIKTFGRKKLIVAGKGKRKWLYALLILSTLYDALVRKALYNYEIYDDRYVEQKVKELEKIMKEKYDNDVDKMFEELLMKLSPY